MKHIFEKGRGEEIKNRIDRLEKDTKQLWGKMNVSQMLAHCAAGFEVAVGEVNPPRMLIGRVLGGTIKKLALRDDEPMKKNSPTIKGMKMTSHHDFEIEKKRLQTVLDRFIAAGPDGVTTHPHSFFGKMSSQEWAILMYKHLDHHLKQFGV